MKPEGTSVQASASFSLLVSSNTPTALVGSFIGRTRTRRLLLVATMIRIQTVPSLSRLVVAKAKTTTEATPLI
jgi:hypothetical protein